MTDYTQEQAERIGREAVALDFMEWAQWTENSDTDRIAVIRHGRDILPDVRSRLTAKAFELWTEEVALELSWAAVDAIERGWYEDGAIRTYWVHIYTTAAQPGFGRHEGPTQVEAELAAVKAMREGEKQ